MLSWEYPPKSVGGLAPHVHGLAGALATRGHEVHIVTQGGDGLPEQDDDRGVLVHRIHPYALWALDFAGGIHHLNFAFLEKAAALAATYGEFDVIHAHDWLSAFAGRALKHAWQKPLIATIHATEWGRHNGLHNDLQRYISQVEWWLCYESWRVIVCSRHMQRELSWIFQLPVDKMAVIPNGVHPEEFAANQVTNDFNRSDYAADQERLIVYVGRLVWEKGVQILIEAVPEVLDRFPDAKLVITGTGSQLSYLRHLARARGVGHKVLFTGYVATGIKVGLLRAADVAVFPSLYEPFGIVALEAMAAGTPVVVGETGGLAEIIDHRRNGLKTYPGNASSLAAQIKTVLGDPGLAQAMVKEAGREISRVYSWQAIAEQTLGVYQAVCGNLGQSRRQERPFPLAQFFRVAKSGVR